MSDTPGIDAGRGEATWRDGERPPLHRPKGPLDWLRVIRRGIPAVAVLLIGVLLILPMRGVERMFYGQRRPWTGPHVQIVCRLTLLCMGIGWRREGVPMNGPGAVVANHSSWLDILTMNAAMPVFFVSKAEVKTWPGINILTKVTNTHFVVRDPKLARAQADEFAQRVRAGHRLLFFPEGTSSDGRRVLPFKPTLFQGFLDPVLPNGLVIQPLTANYFAPPGQDARFYGWWGDMDLGPHLLSVLSVPKQGHVVIRLHAPVLVRDQTRKTLSAACELAVRGGHESAMLLGQSVLEDTP